MARSGVPMHPHSTTAHLARVPVQHPAILDHYLHFPAEHRGTGTDRIERHRVYVEAFLQSLEAPNTCSDIDSQTVSRFIIRLAPAFGRSERKAMCTALRTFLRFLQFRGILTQDLTAVW